tara:strand:- start:377 stop:1207 length:831 start_codon:yes stop_codon:yes gene_type:complete
MLLNESLTTELAKLRNDNFIEDKEDIIAKLSKLLIQSIAKRKSEEKIAIAFSGGIDSTLIAYICEKLNQPFSLYTIGFEYSKDMVSAEAVAKEMNWELNKIILRQDQIERLCKEVIAITKKNDPITVGVGIVTLSVAKEAKENILFTGLGSEEIFAGYERHKGNVHEECWKGLLDIFDRDIKRDLSIGKNFSKELRLPFLDKELIEFSMQIKSELKVQEFRKQILREAALSLGLQKEIAFRKKCAAQYGSKVDKAIEKLAKEKGMKKKEYLVSLNN